jgi:ATP-dependent Lhr-like helicase
MAADNLVESGEFIPGGTGEEWCDLSLLQEIHRRSLALARREVEARKPHEYGAFLAHWQGIDSERYGTEGLAATLNQLCSLWLPAAAWENSVLPNRVRDFHPSQVDQLIASGQFFWRAHGNEHQLQLSFEKMTFDLERTEAIPNPNSLEEGSTTSLLSTTARIVYELLRDRGALSLPQVMQQTKFSTVMTWQALEELCLASLVTNDTMGPIRHLLRSRPQDRVGARGVLSSSVIAQMGRWSLPPVETTSIKERAWIYLNRYGLICRELVQAEAEKGTGSELGPWGELYPHFDILEQIGKVRRGYFCDGLSAIQYALPAAVEQLRLPLANNLEEIYALQWDDPANPLRIIKNWPWTCDSGAKNDLDGKFDGDYIAFQAGNPVLSVMGRKLRVQAFETSDDQRIFEKSLQALFRILYRVYPDQKIVLTHWNGQPIMETAFVGMLERLGFEKGFQEMVLWPSKRKNF